MHESIIRISAYIGWSARAPSDDIAHAICNNGTTARAAAIDCAQIMPSPVRHKSITLFLESTRIRVEIQLKSTILPVERKIIKIA